MKTFLSLVLICLVATGAALAGRPAANIHFLSERGVPFAVLLDGQPLSRGLVRQARAEWLAPGMHYVDFSVPTARGRAVRLQSRVWLEPGLETSFVLIARPGRPLSLQPAGAVSIYRPGYRAPGQPYRDDRWQGYYGSPGAYERGNGNRPSPAYPIDPYQHSLGQVNTGDLDSGYDRESSASGTNYPNTSTTYAPLAAVEIRELTQALARVTYEDEQLQVSRQTLNQRSIYADDLAQILRRLRTDKSRVELAKFAYPLVADQQNFYKVYPAFSYSASAREVQNAVENR